MAKKTKKTLILKRKHGRLNRKSLGKCKKTFFLQKNGFPTTPTQDRKNNSQEWHTKMNLLFNAYIFKSEISRLA